jgi:hypothetical protein
MFKPIFAMAKPKTERTKRNGEAQLSYATMRLDFEFINRLSLCDYINHKEA